MTEPVFSSVLEGNLKLKKPINSIAIFIVTILLLGSVLSTSFMLGTVYEKTEQNKRRCYEDIPCVFGPGIVGTQRCWGGELEKCKPFEPECRVSR